jgi:hypothetical protein
MNDLIDEVAEDLKEEKYRNLVQKVTKLFVILALFVVVSVSLYVWKENKDKNIQMELGQLFNQAISASENNKLDDAIVHLNKIIEHPDQQYAALAYLNKASLLFKQGKSAEAQKALLEMIEHKHFDAALRELAQLTYFSSQLNEEQTDKHKASLAKLANENKPWKLSALQLKALYEIKNNNIKEAKESLNQILASKEATRASYDTASSILSSISQTE